MAYVDASYYANVYDGKNEIMNFDAVSRKIDTLTFNRIRQRGFENLTEFQKDTVRDCCCKLADFEYENEGLVSGGISGYSINGVSVSLDKGWGVIQVNGIIIPPHIYEELKQTGLCWRYV